MENFVNISFDFIDKYVRFTKPEYVQVYLYIKYIAEKDGKVPSADDIAKALDISPAKAEFILEYWTSRGEIEYRGKKYYILDEGTPVAKNDVTKTQRIKQIKSSKPAYSQAEIDAVAASNKQVSGLFYQAETILDKVLTASDMELLFSFNDWLGLPVEVIMMLLSYASKKGKTTKHYLETVAIDWAEKGIDTYEAAEEYVSRLEAADNAENEIRAILGIYNRALTSTERKYIKKWAACGISMELVTLAYDRTVENTGKLSCGYMDKILESWAESGLVSADDVKAADEEFYKGGTKPNRKTQKSKFNNYEDANSTDYAALEEEILDMMLDSID